MVGINSKGLEHGLPPVAAVLFRSGPFDVLVAGFHFPIFELPRVVGSWVKAGGSDDCLDKCFL